MFFVLVAGNERDKCRWDAGEDGGRRKEKKYTNDAPFCVFAKVSHTTAHFSSELCAPSGVLKPVSVEKDKFRQKQ